jgi:hypothetical protein
MQILFQGQVAATPTAATILIEGVQVFSGQVGAGQPLNTTIDYANLVSNGGAVSISVTSGILNVGQVFKWDTSAPAWSNSTAYNEGDAVEYGGDIWLASTAMPANMVPAGTPGVLPGWKLEPVTNDVRSNILINGQPPEWPATPVTPMPGGDEENPDWTGWGFSVSAGETITFII